MYHDLCEVIHATVHQYSQACYCNKQVLSASAAVTS